MNNKPAMIIDGSYIVKSVPAHIDYKKMKSKIEELIGAEIDESFYFNSYKNGQQNVDQDKFHNWMKSAAPVGPKISPMLYPLKAVNYSCEHCNKRNTKSVQKGVDVAMATMMFRLAYHRRTETIVLVAGDGDLASAVNFLKDLDQKFIMVGFKDTMSPDLQTLANKIIFLDDIFDFIKK